MKIFKENKLLLPVCLITLSIIPLIAGIVRLSQLINNADITHENARFFASPLPVTVHIISSIIYSILGSLQFSSHLRKKNPMTHRTLGKLLIHCGLISALSGLWMTQFYPAANFDGFYLYTIRLVIGFSMILFIYLGYAAVINCDISSHQNWMMRAYALGLGAGTQVFTHIPWFIFPSIQGELARAIFMSLGWGINLLIAEYFISRKHNNIHK